MSEFSIVLNKKNNHTVFNGKTLEELIYKLWIFKNTKSFCFSLTSVVKNTKPIIYDDFIFLKHSLEYLNKKHCIKDFFITEYEDIEDAFRNSYS